MRESLHIYLKDQSGAVTVDWVVLTAAVVGLGISAAMSIADGTIEIGDNLRLFLQTEEPFIQNE